MKASAQFGLLFGATLTPLMLFGPRPFAPLAVGSLVAGVLIVAGGCGHEYDKQPMALKEGIEARIHAIVDIAYNPDKTTKATFEIYKAKDWDKDFDVIVFGHGPPILQNGGRKVQSLVTQIFSSEV